MHPLNQLNLHLQLVATSLPLATQKRPETVHQLRVNTRRSLSALSVFGGLLDPQEAKWMTKQLRRIRKAAGAARDLDVLEQRYKRHKDPRDPQLLRKIRKRRRDAQQPIDRLTESLIANGRFQAHVVQLMDTTMRRRVPSDAAILELMRAGLAREASKFVKTLRRHDSTEDPKMFHRLRLRTKDLRYATEFCEPVLDDAFRATVNPIITQLQERLGNINDRASAIRRLAKWKSGCSSKRQAKAICNKIADEQKELQKLMRNFETWLPAKAAVLRCSLDGLLTHDQDRKVLSQ